MSSPEWVDLGALSGVSAWRRTYWGVACWPLMSRGRWGSVGSVGRGDHIGPDDGLFESRADRSRYWGQRYQGI